MLNLVLFGPPGAGKGTQAERLISTYNLIHLSTGDLLRSEIGNQTALGLEAKKLMDQGLLVPDEVVIGMIRSRLENNPEAKGFIFDGFPRTIAQAEALDKLLSEMGTEISAMLSLQVGEEELVARLLNRGKDSGRPDDKDEQVIRHRIHVYESNTAPLKDYYKAQNKLSPIAGVGEIDEITNSLCEAIDRVKS